jgi:hypothetical protein
MDISGYNNNNNRKKITEDNMYRVKSENSNKTMIGLTTTVNIPTRIKTLKVTIVSLFTVVGKMGRETRPYHRIRIRRCLSHYIMLKGKESTGGL